MIKKLKLAESIEEIIVDSKEGRIEPIDALFNLLDRIQNGDFDLDYNEVKRIASVGEKIKIIANTNEHDFEIDSVVLVTDWDEFGVEAKAVTGGQSWFVRHTDYVVLERKF